MRRASSISPFASVRAFLQSIMPAPVSSRSWLTIFAVISAIACSSYKYRTDCKIARRERAGQRIHSGNSVPPPMGEAPPKTPVGSTRRRAEQRMAWPTRTRLRGRRGLRSRLGVGHFRKVVRHLSVLHRGRILRGELAPFGAHAGRLGLVGEALSLFFG